MRKTTIIILVLLSVVLLACNTVSSAVVQTDTTTTSTNTPTGLTRGLKVGNLAPDFELINVEGGSVALSELKAENKPTLVYFFATWCPFCAQDFTTLSEVYPEYEDDVVVVASSLDTAESASKISAYRQKYSGLGEVNFATGKEEVLKNYNVRYTTTKYAIGRDGTILYAGSGPLTEDQWKILLDLLKES